jgi:hypothetical protein
MAFAPCLVEIMLPALRMPRSLGHHLRVRLFVTEGTVEKHIHSILMKLPLPETEDDRRRVLAVMIYLDAR